MTSNKSINLSPVWSPDARSIAFTSYMSGYPYLYRLFPFENRPIQLLAGFRGINSSPAFSPDGQSVALTLSKDGNPEVYVLNLATGALRRLTSYAAIDTEPTWSPTGREIAFVSDRAGRAHVFVMDAEGTNVRRLTQGGFNTQPRWSPKGDTIVYTSRQGNSRSLGGESRRLEPAPAHRRSRQQRGRLVGPERPPPRVPVEPAREAISSSRCSPTDRSSSRSRRAPENHKCRLVTAPSVIRCFGNANSR